MSRTFLRPTLDPYEVDARRCLRPPVVSPIPELRMQSGPSPAADQLTHPLASDVKHFQGHISRPRRREDNLTSTSKGIRSAK